MKNLKKFVLDALLMCIVAFLMRTVGVSFNVYISNRMGAEAMGLYSLLSGVYGFALTLATSGVSLATMRLISESLGKGDLPLARRSLRTCLIYSLSFGGCATLLLFMFSPLIAEHLLHDLRTARPLRILSLSLLPVSLTSVFGGYFTAVRRVYKNAAVQVSEQAIRIFSISTLLSLFLPRGIEYACMALALGGVLSDLASLLFSLFAYLIERKKQFPPSCDGAKTHSLTSKLLGITLPVAVSAYARSGLISLEHMLIPIGLRKHGDSQENALASYGRIHGMVLPVILFPSALIGSFSGLLVPEISECHVQGNLKQIRYIAERVLWLSLLFSIGVAGIIAFLSGELGQVIYPGKETHQYIKMLAPLIPIMYIDTGVDAILKGMGKQVYSMAVNIIDAGISVILVWLLTPRIGILGYVVTIYVSETVNTVCSFYKLLKVSGLCPKPIKWMIKPLVCIIGATLTAKLLLPMGNSGALALTLHILLLLALYILYLLLLRAVNKEDIEWLFSIFKKEKSIHNFQTTRKK